ncbi:MAG: hypothetical protein GWO24_03385 [Akkermansiaceae bacterium]|nr:hypothetical protein [Akkermansiaceae bacterium]
MSVLFVACRPAPSDDAAREAIVSHFGSRHYRVVELELADISPITTGEKTYMGVPAFRVKIRKITIRVERGMPPGSGIARGELVTFRDAGVLLKEPRDGAGRYAVSDVQGVALP